MASGARAIKAALAALAVCVAPQTALGDLSAVDLSDMRRALTTLKAELAADPDALRDINAMWQRLPLDGAAPAPAAQSPFAAPDTLVKSVQEAPRPVDPSGAFFAGAAASVPVTPQQPGAALGVWADAPDHATPLDAGLTDFRIMLAALAQTYTGKNNQAVINAQGPRGTVAISIRSGEVGLTDLQAFSASLGHPPRPDGTLTTPVVIWSDATLRLGPGERLGLARDTGAFLMSMGRLDVNGATIESVGPENPHTPSFTPFVTVMQGGSLDMRGATLRNLGFGQTPKFSGLSVAGSLISRDRGSVHIEDSLFDSLKVVSLVSTQAPKIIGVTFRDARDAALHLMDAPGAEVRRTLFVGHSPTNAIRVDQGSTHVVIERNMFLAGERVAVLVDAGSDHVQVRGNLIWQRAGAGIKFLRTRCGLIEDNLILDNRQKGVEVRRSTGTVVRDNLIAGNRSAGIWVSAQGPAAQTALNDNVLHGNGAGVSAATGAEILMQGNNFAKQFPRLLDGDIARLTRYVAVDLRGDVGLRIRDGQAATGPTDALCGSAL
ncbi:MAG: right-handed parallel beta-helix repeat-containing protein [Pseudomonadota bacterium]